MVKIWKHQETESTIGTAQDQAISTNYFKNKFLKNKFTLNASYINKKNLLTP
jgi:hypothetical protein